MNDQNKKDEKRYNSLRKEIETVMTKHYETRNSDKLLMIMIWALHLPEDMTMIRLCNLTREQVDRLPTPSTIFRIRRVIQNDEEKLLPTDENILKQRAKKIDRIKRWLEIQKRDFFLKKYPIDMKELLAKIKAELNIP